MKVNTIHLDDEGKPSEFTVTMSDKEAAFILAFLNNLSPNAVKNLTGTSEWGHMVSGAGHQLDEIFIGFYDGGYTDIVPSKLGAKIHLWGQDLNKLA